MSTMPLSEWVVDLESGARPKGGIKDGVGEIPSLGAEHLSDDGGFNLQNPKMIPADFFYCMKKGHIQENDILVVKDGATTGKVSFVGRDFPFESAAINEHVFRISIDRRRADPFFVFLFLRSPAGQAGILSDFRGATVGGIGRTFVDKVQVPNIDLQNQRRIAAILDKAACVRRNCERAKAIAEDLPRSTFLNIFGDPLLNNRGFTPATIEDLCEVITDCLHTTPDHFDEPNAYPSIRSSELRDGYIDLATAKYVTTSEYHHRIQRYRPLPGDTIYCREGARFGGVGIIPEGMTPCLGQRTMLFKANTNVATPEYLWSVLCSKAILKQANDVVGGAASPHVNIRDIRKFKCVLPPIQLQQHFSRICRNVFKQRERLSDQINQSERLLSSLSQRAFRGEL